MSKKTLVIIVSAVLTLLLISLIGYYFIISNNDGTTRNTIVSGFNNFFPFGGSEENTPNPDVTDNQNNENQNNTTQEPIDFIKKLRKISTEPVSGAGTLDLKAGTIVRYIEKATGHVYEVELFSPKITRISNTTIPLSYDAIWGNNGSSFVARYLGDDNDTVDTFSLTVKNTSTSTENTITGIAFPERIIDVAVFGSSIFYLQNTYDGSSGVISNFDGTKKKEIWNSPMKEFISQYVNTKTVLLNTKPSETIAGYLYSVDTTTGTVKKLLSGLGLISFANSDLSKILYLTNTNGTNLFVFDTKTKLSLAIFPITFPEKCVWGKKDKTAVFCAVPKSAISASSLTSWYKGLLSTSDNIWKFNTVDGTSKLIVEISKESGEEIDIVKPIISENEQFIVFVNKKDNSLWSLDLMK